MFTIPNSEWKWHKGAITLQQQIHVSHLYFRLSVVNNGIFTTLDWYAKCCIREWDVMTWTNFFLIDDVNGRRWSLRENAFHTITHFIQYNYKLFFLNESFHGALINSDKIRFKAKLIYVFCFSTKVLSLVAKQNC